MAQPWSLQGFNPSHDDLRVNDLRVNTFTLREQELQIMVKRHHPSLHPIS